MSQKVCQYSHSLCSPLTPETVLDFVNLTVTGVFYVNFLGSLNACFFKLDQSSLDAVHYGRMND